MAKKGSKFNKYTYEFKVMVVEDYLSGKSGGIDTITKKYNLKSSYQVRNWLKKYKKDISLSINGLKIIDQCTDNLMKLWQN